MKNLKSLKLKELAKAIENSENGSIINFPRDRKCNVIDTYQKKGNWRLFSKNGQVLQNALRDKIDIITFIKDMDYFTPIAEKFNAIEAKEKSKASKASSKVKAENFPKRRSAIDLMENARLYEKTVYGSNAYFCLAIDIVLDSFSFAGMEKAEKQKKPVKTPLSRWLGGATVDLSNFFYREFALPCRSPEIDIKKRASNGYKTITFYFYFDVENKENYTETIQNKEKYKEIAKDIYNYFSKNKKAQ